MKRIIVSDSSSNIFAIPGAAYTTVPMKVIFGGKEYIDSPDLDVKAMVDDLRHHKGKSGSSCPNVQEWLDAFGDADEVFGLTISKNLSGSYNSAKQAAEIFKQENPDKKIFIFDTLTAGPQQAMLADKLHELISQGLDFETVRVKAQEYHDHTHIMFCLESMNNLARNGRVNPAVAKIAGLLGIRACGSAPNGFITAEQKPRGMKKAMDTLVQMMADRGMQDGNLVRVAHCFGLEQANALKEATLAKYPNARFVIEPTTALCSFYAEEGGLMIGLEGGFNEPNKGRDF